MLEDDGSGNSLDSPVSRLSTWPSQEMTGLVVLWTHTCMGLVLG